MEDDPITPATDSTPTPTEEFKPITSPEQFDEMIKDRIERAKKSAIPEDYEEVKAAAAGLKAMTRRAEEAEAERDKLKVDAQLEAWKSQVATETGVPAAVLRGDTLEELQAHANQIKGAMPVYPPVKESGGTNPPATTKEKIFEIANPRVRRAAILANLELFDHH